MKAVLIVTNTGDLHADEVERRLRQRGQAFFRLDLDAFPKDYALAIRTNGEGQSGLLRRLPSGEELSLPEIGAVWVRKRAPFGFPAADLGVQERAFAEAETEHVLFSLLHSLDAYWMSHPAAMRAALWKGEQLLRAARMGFAIPASIVTNRRDSLDAFREACGGDIIFKALSSPTLGGEDVADDDVVVGNLGATRITSAHDDILDAVCELPTFFQRHVVKQYEIRATVIGEQVFAARIDSQSDPRTAVDYRDFSVEIPYTVERLPADVERRCLDFVHSYGLNYGALDLIVTPAGEHVFLENNPGGQFLFVEQLVPELRMLDAVADCLIQGAAA